MIQKSNNLKVRKAEIPLLDVKSTIKKYFLRDKTYVLLICGSIQN